MIRGRKNACFLQAIQVASFAIDVPDIGENNIAAGEIVRNAREPRKNCVLLMSEFEAPIPNTDANSVAKGLR